MSISVADRFSLLIAELDDIFREEESVINELLTKCKELVEELDSVEYLD